MTRRNPDVVLGIRDRYPCARGPALPTGVLVRVSSSSRTAKRVSPARRIEVADGLEHIVFADLRIGTAGVNGGRWPERRQRVKLLGYGGHPPER
jgi:hypothetical protein